MKQKHIDLVFGPFIKWMQAKNLNFGFHRQAWEALALLALWNTFLAETQAKKKSLKEMAAGDVPPSEKTG
ncbi:MAG: hypothetical protein AB1330_01715 [Bacillota bacterium]